jgi:type I restriction enzyme R subunit
VPGSRSTGSRPRPAGPSSIQRTSIRSFPARSARSSWLPGHGRADYALYLDREVVGVIEAKPAGTPLSGVEWQSATYAAGLPDTARKRLYGGKLPFVFEANGVETHFTNGYDPEPRSRRFFGFPRPDTLARWIRDESTWRGHVTAMPSLLEHGLRPAQIEAVRGVERSLADQQNDRSLVQMVAASQREVETVLSRSAALRRSLLGAAFTGRL